MRSRSAAWWADRGSLERVVSDLIAAELARIRPGRAAPPLPWPASMTLDEDGLGVDSLDRLKLATALGEAIHLHQSGIEDTLLGQPTLSDWLDTARRSLDRYSAEVTFHTSGSTGEPKWCVHALADLSAEIDVLAPRFALCERVISTVPSHHIYGFLFTILLPARLGIEVIDVRRSSPARLAQLLRPGDLIVGHPIFWAAFVRSVPVVQPGISAVSSTAPCPIDVARAVTASGIDSLIEVYGSSETAGIGWRDVPTAAYELFPYWRCGANADELIRRLPDGAERVLHAPDSLAWLDARHIRPTGRREGAVQVGGHNVFPEHVRDVLCGHAGVADAAVRLMRPDEGDRLKAFIVAVDPLADRAALREELWAWVAQRLRPAERPTAIAFGTQLPAGALGKRADWPALGN